MVFGFEHNLDPVIVSVAGLGLWWYGLSFTLGFLNAHIFIRRNRESVGLSLPASYDLTICLALGTLLGGRAVIVFVNEWSFYRDFPELIPAIWIGGFASHGLLVGGAIAVTVYCLVKRIPMRPVLDLLAISAAIIMGFGRIGNFIDGQIVGSLTGLPWGVDFPESDGFRHPVVLYDGLKNFVLVPLLIWLRNRGAPPGRVAVLFVILYSGLRIPIDFLREYPVALWSLPTGQLLNILMLVTGIVLLGVNVYRARLVRMENPERTAGANGANWIRVTVLVAVCVIPLVIPSDATRDVKQRYGNRHPDLVNSPFYPDIDHELAKRGKR